MTKKQSQVIDVRATKGFTSGGESNEILRIASKGAYLAKMSNAFDPTREHLDFEVINGKIYSLNKRKSIGKREKDNLNKREIKDPNKGKDKPVYRTVADFIIGGSQFRMREMAFGDQDVNYDKGADNSSVVRNKEIEDWAIDVYNFFAKKFGEQNIAAFVVHLDETNPHVHCKVLPVTESNKLSWRLVMVGKDNTKEAYRQNMLKLHNDFYNAVGSKYGLERGEHISETKAQHRTTEQYHEWHLQELQKKNYFLQEDNKKLAENNESLKKENEGLTESIKQNEIKVKSLNTMILNLNAQIDDLKSQLEDLDRQREEGMISTVEYGNKVDKLQKDLKFLVDKKKDKEDKYQEALLKLEKLQGQISSSQKQQEIVNTHLEALKTQLHKDLPEAQQQTNKNMEIIGYGVETNRIVNLLASYKTMLESMTPEERKPFEERMSPLLEDTIQDFGENAGNIVQIATNLFLGYIDQATTISNNCGGGGSPGTGWGRKDDDDDWRFSQRCFLTAMKMVKPSKKPQQQVSAAKGIRR